jgi:CTP synthase (UTP-ammonia lyase)
MCAVSCRCFASVAEKAVIEERDVEHTIYEVPLTLHAEGLDQLVCDLLHLETPEPDLERLEKISSTASSVQANASRSRWSANTWTCATPTRAFTSH